MFVQQLLNLILFEILLHCIQNYINARLGSQGLKIILTMSSSSSNSQFLQYNAAMHSQIQGECVEYTKHVATVLQPSVSIVI